MEKDPKIVLSVEHLFKEYLKNGHEKVIALNDVSFELKQGEILGVIGRNGSGKSTLLKVLSRITGVTDGTVSYEGKLTSIIEIGTGFHPDLSGRENVRLSGLLLGVDIRKGDVYDEIIAFSGLEDFMEMPVKYYSSGMYLRLAFSIAFLSRVDILLLDEVLAVGDEDFRRKCYQKVRELKKSGTSIVLISHQLEPVMDFCDRCLWLDNGSIQESGDSLDVIEAYLNVVENNSGLSIRGSQKSQIESLNIESLKGVNHIKCEHLELENISLYVNGDTNVPEEIYTRDSVEIVLECNKLNHEDSFEISFYLTNSNGSRVIMDSFSLRENYTPQKLTPGKYSVRCTIPANFLAKGFYKLGLIVGRNNQFVMEEREVLKFRMSTRSELNWGGRANNSLLMPHLNWEIQSINS